MNVPEQVVQQAAATRLTGRQIFKMLADLFKLRVVSLLVFAALGGTFLGASGRPPAGAVLATVFSGTLAAAGASAINQYLEQAVDQQMRRTRRRPLPSGGVEHPAVVLWIAVSMIAIAVLSALPSNPIMALYLLLGALIYVGIYTIWLKPRSVLNIVIGGAAGSMAVMTGGAAVGAASDPGVIVLALLIFLWTPVHFWALAMFYRDDYARADIPMLPVRTTSRSTAWWIFIHAITAGVAALMLMVHPALGWAYLVPVGIGMIWLLVRSVRLIQVPEKRLAIKLFVTSNVFLALVLLTIIVVSTMRALLVS